METKMKLTRFGEQYRDYLDARFTQWNDGNADEGSTLGEWLLLSDDQLRVWATSPDEFFYPMSFEYMMDRAERGAALTGPLSTLKSSLTLSEDPPPPPTEGDPPQETVTSEEEPYRATP